MLFPCNASGQVGSRFARSDRGFTLVELMIVVVIIGILAAVALPNFFVIQSRAKEAQVKENCHIVSLSCEDFAVQTGGIYPTAVAEMTPFFPQGNLLTNPFAHTQTEPSLGNAPALGEVHYEAVLSGGGVSEGYVIRGGGINNMIVITVGDGAI